MADALPKIRVTDAHSREGAPASASPASTPTPDEGGDEGRSGTPASTRSRSSARSQQKAAAVENTGAADVGESQAPIDPLSQQIFRRTNTQPDVLHKFRPSHDEAAASRPYADDGSAGPKIFKDPARSETTSSAPSKKKGVSFLSRIIGNKKKGALDGADNGDADSLYRPEGMDAELFSQPIDNIGFQPQHPQPPGYIKIRSKFKKEREFDRVFLAQELYAESQAQTEARPSTGAAIGASDASNPPPAAEAPIWAIEFSKDGRYLAAGGQDRIVRVWAVISTPEERLAHEQAEERANGAHDGQGLHLNAPVFQKKTFREYAGHESTVLDLSWSKNNFLLSSSMDKTVRLWHISRAECLCTFKHADFVPSIQFHPKDDRFFLAGSLDSKLRLWSIPDKTVAFWNQLPEMITAVAFTPDGKTAIAGTLNGLCLFYETEGLKYQTQIHVKSSRGKNAKGSKITGIQAMHMSPEATSGDLKLLISSNDSRIRLYGWRDKGLEVKFRGQENNFSQIRATFSDDARYVICGSEDRRAYIWSTGPAESENRSQRPVEMFDAHSSITTCAIMVPTKTRQLLSGSQDPVYDLCNPPPVTLMSRTESISSRPPSEAGSNRGAATANKTNFRKAQETPAYIARSAHPGGQIMVTADYTGHIKVFRQDCAYTKRKNINDNWETSSVFSRKTIGSGIGVRRSNSTKTRASSRKRRDSTATTATQPSSDRILSWRQNISGTGSIKDGRAGKMDRSSSPRNPSFASSARSSHAAIPPLPNRSATESIYSVNPPDSPAWPKTSGGGGRGPDPDGSNPPGLHGDQPYAYYDQETWRNQLPHGRPPPSESSKKVSYVSRMSSGDSSIEGERG